MPTPPLAPTLAQLEADLERAERAIVCADYIDKEARRQVELADARRRRDAIKAQIARIRESF